MSMRAIVARCRTTILLATSRPASARRPSPASSAWRVRRRSSSRCGSLSYQRADLAVEVPADVVEGLGQGFDVGDGAAAQVEEADDDIGDLHARVVDVVLDLRRLTEPAERAGQDVAEHGVTQVADVRRLVRIDVRVLDDHLGLRVDGRGTRHRKRVDHRGREPAPVEVEVHVAGAFDRDPLETLGQLEALDEAFRDRPRRLAQLTREVQGTGTREVAQTALRRHFDHRVVIEAEGSRQGAPQRGGDDGSFALQHRGRSLYKLAWARIRTCEDRRHDET